MIGMGHVGSLVANAAIDLGMDVIGYDPYLSVDAAWNLTARVQRAATLADAVKGPTSSPSTCRKARKRPG